MKVIDEKVYNFYYEFMRDYCIGEKRRQDNEIVWCVECSKFNGKCMHTRHPKMPLVTEVEQE